MLLAEQEFGIQRSTELATLPERACLRSALNHIEEIDTVSEFGYWPDSLSPGEVPNSRYFSFHYNGDGYWAHLVVRTSRTGRIHIKQDRTMINRRPKAGEIDRTRAVMKIVEETLAEECQVDISNVVEECEGIRCPE